MDELTPRLREALIAGEGSVRSNAKATPLVRDLPVSLDPDEAAVGGWDVAELRRLFEFLEFRTLWDRLVEATGAGKADVTSASRLAGAAAGGRCRAAGQCRRAPSSGSTRGRTPGRHWPWPPPGRAGKGDQP